MTKKAARKRTSLTFPHLLSSVSKEEKKKLDFLLHFNILLFGGENIL